MERTNNKQQIIYGLRPVIEAIESGAKIEKVLIQNALNGELAGTLKGRIREHGVAFQYVPIEKLNRLAKGNHQGVVAIIGVIEYQDIMTVLNGLQEQDKSPLILLLDHLTDVRNVGAIARTAECAGVDAIVIPDNGTARLNDDAIKTSSGALLRIPICREKSLKTAVNIAAEFGLQIVAATEKGAVHYKEVDMSLPTMLIMGNEEKGIGDDLLKMSNVRAYLPMNGEVQSLNVSVAAGIFLYEALSQRGK